jgi:hypothetical protein
MNEQPSPTTDVAQPPEPAAMPSPPAPPADAGQPTGVRIDEATTLRFEDGQLILTDETGATTAFTYNAENVIPPEVPEIIGLSFAGLIGIIMAFPIGRAIARFIDRRGTAPRVPADVTDRLAAIEQAIDSVAVEVERMSEANRYTTKLLVERGGAPDFSAGARGAEPLRESSARSSDAARG